MRMSKEYNNMTTKEKPQTQIGDIKASVEEFIKKNPIEFDSRGILKGDLDDLFTDINCAMSHYANAYDYVKEDMNVSYREPVGQFISAIQNGGTSVWDEAEAEFKPDMSHPAIDHLQCVIEAFETTYTEPGALISKVFQEYGEEAHMWVEEMIGSALNDVLQDY